MAVVLRFSAETLLGSNFFTTTQRITRNTGVTKSQSPQEPANIASGSSGFCQRVAGKTENLAASGAFDVPLGSALSLAQAIFNAGASFLCVLSLRACVVHVIKCATNG